MRLAALIAFVAGVCWLQTQASLPDLISIAAVVATALAAVAMAVTAALRKTALARVLALAAAVMLGFSWAAARSTVRLADQLAFEDEGRDVQVEGTIASLPSAVERGVRFEFDVERVLTPQVHVPGRVLLGWYAQGIDPRPGERWRFTLRLRRPHGVLNPGGFDLEAWMLERNLRASGYVRTANALPARLGSSNWRPDYAIERGRAVLRDELRPRLAGARYGGVIVALILGDQRAIGAADWTLFNRTGISHLVSISGLHITMIAGLAGLALSALWRRVPWLLARAAAQTAGVVTGLLAALGYAMLAGWGVPAQRTVLMLAVVAFAWLARSRIAMPTALALAAALVCLVDPWAVLAPGFWLSFGAVAAIVWVAAGRVARDAPGWWRAVSLAVRVQLAVTVALMPALIVLFHQLPLASPVANALAIPLVSWAVTPLALLGAALAALPGPLAGLADAPLTLAHAIFDILASALQWIAAQRWATMAVATPPALVVALSVAGVGWLLAPPGWPLRSAGALALLPIFIWPAARPGEGEFWITALDVGQGAAVLLESSDSVWLYDTGPRHTSDTDAGERVILPFLRHRGIGRLDGLIVSHLDVDHSGGAASLLRALKIGTVVSSVAAGHAIFNGRADVERCTIGKTWTTGAMKVEILHPADDDYARRRSSNALSCVVLASVAGVRALLTGDLPAAEEATLALRLPTPVADWMMVPHHGSRSSSSDALLGVIGAKWAVAQAGYRNRFGHPDRSVLARYAAHGIRVTRTDQRGAVHWRYADGRLSVTAWREVAARYWHNRPTADRLTADSGVPDDDGEPLPGPPEPYIAG